MPCLSNNKHLTAAKFLVDVSRRRYGENHGLKWGVAEAKLRTIITMPNIDVSMDNRGVKGVEY